MNALSAHINNYFTTIFTSSKLSALQSNMIPTELHGGLYNELVTLLDQPLQTQEITNALSSLGSWKAPSKDGLHALLPKRC